MRSSSLSTRRACRTRLALGDLRRDPTVHPLPERENEGETRECLKVACGQRFQEQLDGWFRAPESWPVRRDLDTFSRWFKWSLHSVVVDVLDEPSDLEEI